MSSKQPRRFGAEKKAQIVRRHLADKVPVSDLADEFGVQPSQIYAWVKQVLDQAETYAIDVDTGTMINPDQSRKLDAKYLLGFG